MNFISFFAIFEGPRTKMGTISHGHFYIFSISKESAIRKAKETYVNNLPFKSIGVQTWKMNKNDFPPFGTFKFKNGCFHHFEILDIIFWKISCLLEYFHPTKNRENLFLKLSPPAPFLQAFVLKKYNFQKAKTDLSCNSDILHGTTGTSHTEL